jgi:hypothetical protein
MNLHRHGELTLRPVAKIPAEAKLAEAKQSLIVAHSESGHHHTLTIPSVKDALIKFFEFEGKTYLDIPLQAKLEHQKTGNEIHGTQEVEPGLYERIIKRSYSYAAKVMRRVQD